jgi:PhzF family phenazine biosynthesis protein
MGLKISQIDAFTDRLFAGNPAAVCLLPAWRDDAWMQNVAAEMNLAETAFLVRRRDDFELRWFTPKVEVDLCGHATLASAHYLWECGGLQNGTEARFHTKSGVLIAKQQGGAIELDFPSTPASRVEPPHGLAAALGVEPLSIGCNRFDLLVEVASEDELLAIEPDFRALKKIDVRGTIVTAISDGDYDFVSRYFAPAFGIDEDPVTGSAHCTLGPFWGDRLNKTEMRGYQASKRGGEVGVRLVGDRVVLIGRAVTVFNAELAGSI